MPARLSLLTLGVADLAAAVAFYRYGLGWPTDGIVGTEFEHGAVAFFELEGGLGLALFPRESLAHDVGLPVGDPGSSAVAFGHNVRSRDEVDAVIEQARRAGGKIVKPPVETFWGGYAGYFRDLDGWLWEVAWNPARLPPA